MPDSPSNPLLKPEDAGKSGVSRLLPCTECKGCGRLSDPDSFGSVSCHVCGGTGSAPSVQIREDSGKSNKGAQAHQRSES